MKRFHKVIAAGLLPLAMALGTGLGWAQQDQGSGQRPGDKLDEAGRSIKKGLQDARDAIRDQFARAREAVHNMNIESRVYGRLHWDKALSTSTLDLDVKNGVVTIRGTVPDTKARLKAVELAGDTEGITRVIDQLTVQPLVKTETRTTPPARP
jgi:osmotically-inducible protein OsmY